MESTNNKPLYYDGSGLLTIIQPNQNNTTIIKPAGVKSELKYPYFPYLVK